MTTTKDITLIEDMNTLLSMLKEYDINIDYVTPYGLLSVVSDYFTSTDRSNLYYNSYYSSSLLRNGNKWLVIS